MIIFKIIFFVSLFMIFYVYLGYPILVYTLSVFKKQPVKKEAFDTTVTILIPAYNEEDCIAKTLENKLEQDYPGDKPEVIVISDGSTDRTDEIVQGYKTKGVKLLRQEPRTGKTSALNMAVEKAKGEILVFSDANSLYAPNTVAKLVRNFADPKVGYVTGKMVYTGKDGNPTEDGCSTYMKYENFLRQVETNVGSIVGVDGGIDACRRSLYQPMAPDQLPDFVLPLRVVEQGFRVVFEPEAVLKEPSLKSDRDEYMMRVRVSLRSFWALNDMWRLLTFSPSVIFSWQLWSHKVLRYLCFVFLGAAYLSNLLLWQEGALYKSFFILQNTAYLAAILSPSIVRYKNLPKLLYLPRYFTLLNFASAHAFFKYLMRRRQVLWQPRKG
jgi:cellulose synthase/poly-beta-1,6-N-acetylglucosamine synthase-like glycosyltransferase